MSNKELTKALSEEYKAARTAQAEIQSRLPERETGVSGEMALFREQHPDLVQNSKKPGVPKRSQSKVPKKFQENVQKVKPPQKTIYP